MMDALEAEVHALSNPQSHDNLYVMERTKTKTGDEKVPLLCGMADRNLSMETRTQFKGCSL